MTNKLAAGVAAAITAALALVAPGGTAQADVPPTHVTPRVIVDPVSTPLQRFDVSYGEVEGGMWRNVTDVSYEVVGCTPGESLYWSAGPAYQDGRQLYGVFEGLGEGEDTCKPDGTSTYSSLWYGEKKSLHPGWMTFSVTLYGDDGADLLASATRRVWIPRQHARCH